MVPHPKFSRLRHALIPLMCLLLVISCKKKDSSGTPDEAVPTDLFVIANLRVQDFKLAQLSAEINKNLAALGADAPNFDQLEQKVAMEIGVRPSKIDTVTVAITDVPEGSGPPKMIMILTAQEEIVQDVAKRQLGKGQTDRPGFTALEKGWLLHFPDGKTMVVVHEDLANRYLEGFAKNRNGWPFTSSFRKEADEHTAVVICNLDKVPAAAKQEIPREKLGKLADAKVVSLTLDFKEKEVSVGVRGNYADEATANSAKDSLTSLVNVAKAGIDQMIKSKDAGGMAMFIGPVQKTLNDMKIETTGSELKLAASYKTDNPTAPVLVGLLLPAVQKVREAAARTYSMNNLKQLMLAMNNYNDQMGMLPINGIAAMGQPIRDGNVKPLLSWRVALLPFVEEIDLYNQFKLDEPWDSEHNKKLIGKMPKIFAPPNDAKTQPGRTFYQLVVGPKAMRPGMTIQGIRDGSSNTLAVVEAAEPVIWTKPDDIMIPGDMPSDLKKKFGSAFSTGFLVGFWDGSVRSIDPKKISEKSLWGLITPDGGEVVDYFDY